jgi:hypothetical protein
MLIYAVEQLPSSAPKTAHIALSRKPRLNTSGPKRPTARLLTDTLALNHNRVTCRSAIAEAGWRSSGCTRVMPRASKPARPSMRSFSRRRRDGTGILAGAGTSPLLTSSEELVVVVWAAPLAFSRSWVTAAAIVSNNGGIYACLSYAGARSCLRSVERR